MKAVVDDQVVAESTDIIERGGTAMCALPLRRMWPCGRLTASSFARSTT